MIPLRLPGVGAVGFDLDGTLFDHPYAAAAGARAALAPLRASDDAVLAAWFAAEEVHFSRWLAGVIDVREQARARVRDVYAALGAPEPTDAAADAVFDGFRTAYRANWRAYDDAAQTLQRLRAGGMRIGVLTNGPLEQQRDKLRATGLDSLVDVVCAADDIGSPKPEPAAFDALVTALGEPRERIVYIGDDPQADLAGAQAAGIRAALVRSRGRGVAELPSAVRRAAARPADTRSAALAAL